VKRGGVLGFDCLGQHVDLDVDGVGPARTVAPRRRRARLTVAQPAPVRPRTPTRSGLRRCCTSRANRGSSRRWRRPPAPPDSAPVRSRPPRGPHPDVVGSWWHPARCGASHYQAKATVGYQSAPRCG
jgi:hypothetical protein